MSINKKRIATRATGVAAAAITTATLVVQPSVAHAAEPTKPVPCQPNASYAIGWRADGEWVFGRDCKSDGWGIRVFAYYVDGEYEYYIADVWDHNSSGNGAWRHHVNAPDGQPVVFYVYKTKDDGTEHDLIATIDDRGWHT